MKQIYLSDIPRLFTAIAEWCACVVFILNRPRRFDSLQLWSVLGLGLAVQCLFLCMTDELHIVLWLPCMLGAIGLMFALIAACCDISLPSAGYFTACAFLIAEFAASLEWQLYSFINRFLGREERHTTAASLLFLAVVYAAVFSLVHWLQARRNDPDAALVFHVRELWHPIMISVICFLMGNLSFVYSNTPFSSSAIEGIYNIRTLVDLAGVVMLYAYHIQRCKLYTQQELKNVLQNQYIQYKQSRESIDVVNRKYHDLKHQIAVLRAEQDPQKRLDFLNGMEEEIRTYEAQNKTGNSILDTILTSKSLYCAHHSIELTCVADGARLDFMDAMDICSIFGNILDNAIECELTIDDKEKRLIHLTVYAKNDFLLIQCGNYCEQILEFKHGLPVSTKRNRAYHGFGVRSIQYAAEKYGGTMIIYNRDSWFEINLVIPHQGMN